MHGHRRGPGGRRPAGADPRHRRPATARGRRDRCPGSMRRVAMYHFGWEHADGTPGRGQRRARPSGPRWSSPRPRRWAGSRQPARCGRRSPWSWRTTSPCSTTTSSTRTPPAGTAPRPGPSSASRTPSSPATRCSRSRCGCSPRTRTPPRRAASERLAACVIELCAGQQADCAFEERAPHEVSLDECLAMATAKTGALLGCACALGALYAGGGPGGGRGHGRLRAGGGSRLPAHRRPDRHLGGPGAVPANRPAPIWRPARSPCRWSPR